MHVEQIYTSCLAHAAYYIENNGEAAIFDPLREVQPYIDRAIRDNAKIKYVFETHFHADFVSGHLDLAKKTGATIVYGPTAQPNFEAVVAQDGALFTVGNYTIQAIHTPGHTLESTTYLLIDEYGQAQSLITGDTLFIGDVGRPDLAQHVIAELTEEKLAGYLFDSLRHKIMPLADHLIIYPNHGAGSACGKKMSTETTDTLGHQKSVNYALNPALTKEQFIKVVLAGLTTPPAYFPKNVLLNIKGYDSYDQVLYKGLQPISVDQFKALKKTQSALILDTRTPEAFAVGHIPDSLNISLDGHFAQWVGELIVNIDQPILLITDIGREEEAITRLARVGYDHTIGYLAGGFSTWTQHAQTIQTVERINAETMAQEYASKPLIVDVRKKSEFDTEHVVGAINIPLNQLYQQIDRLPKETPFIVYCAGGYRSMIAASILQQNGLYHFKDVVGGYTSIAKTGIARTVYREPITDL